MHSNGFQTANYRQNVDETMLLGVISNYMPMDPGRIAKFNVYSRNEDRHFLKSTKVQVRTNAYIYANVIKFVYFTTHFI